MHFLIQLRRDILTKFRLFICWITLKDVTLGKGSFLNKHVFFSRRHKFVAGKNLIASRYIHFGSNLQIGDDVLIGPYASFIGGDHKIHGTGDTPIRHAGIKEYKLTVIEDEAWIGHGSIIMAGVRIGKGAVVAAGAIVTKDVAANTIVANNYAKEIGQRKR